MADKSIPVQTVLESIVTLLTEAYPGPPDPSATWFIDNEPDSGILGILKDVTAQEASVSVDGSGKPGTSIAAHAEHLRWSLANANEAFRGSDYNGSWKESWNTMEANEQKWNELRQALRDEFEALVGFVRKQDTLEGDYLTGTLALLPHAAYHLGNIRQMVERVREKSQQNMK